MLRPRPKAREIANGGLNEQSERTGHHRMFLKAGALHEGAYGRPARRSAHRVVRPRSTVSLYHRGGLRGQPGGTRLALLERSRTDPLATYGQDHERPQWQTRMSSRLGRPGRLERVAPFLAMDVLAAAAAKERQGADIVHMEVGQPSAPAPRRAIEAARAALDHGRIGYTEALGTRAAARADRAAITATRTGSRSTPRAGRSSRPARRRVSCWPSWLVFDEERGNRDHGAGLSCLSQHPRGAGPRRRLGARSGSEHGWRLTAAEIERIPMPQAPLDGRPGDEPGQPIRHDDRAPRNSTGSPRFCRRRNRLWLISDEIYHGLTYGASGRDGAFAVHDDAIVINSFSKYYCMTGWRIGWIVVPDRLVRPIERLAQNLYISPPYLSQVAALAAFEAREELEAVKAGYGRARDAPAERTAPDRPRRAPSRPMGRSTSTPTSPGSPMIRSHSAGACSTRPASRRRRESTSIRSTGPITSAFPSRAARRSAAWRSIGCGPGSAAPAHVERRLFRRPRDRNLTSSASPATGSRLSCERRRARPCSSNCHLISRPDSISTISTRPPCVPWNGYGRSSSLPSAGLSTRSSRPSGRCRRFRPCSTSMAA